MVISKDFFKTKKAIEWGGGCVEQKWQLCAGGKGGCLFCVGLDLIDHYPQRTKFWYVVLFRHHRRPYMVWCCTGGK
jgi:hypothetical protein